MNLAVAACLVLVLIGYAAAVSGVAILFGTGWALIALGACAFSAAILLQRGIAE